MRERDGEKGKTVSVSEWKTDMNRSGKWGELIKIYVLVFEKGCVAKLETLAGMIWNLICWTLFGGLWGEGDGKGGGLNEASELNEQFCRRDSGIWVPSRLAGLGGTDAELRALQLLIMSGN